MSKLSYQILVSTMHQNDFSLYKKMNLESDAIIIDQCQENSFDERVISKNNVL